MLNITKCQSYDEKELSKAIDEIVDLGKIVKKDQKVLIKPNLLEAFPPEKAVTTNPHLVKVVVEKIHALGASVTIADSPRWGFGEKRLNEVYTATKMKWVSEETGCELNQDRSSIEIPSKSGLTKTLKVLTVIEESDVLINMSKVKTHTAAYMTCATKNLYGYVPGWTKARYHLNRKGIEDLGKILIDLNDFKTPAVTIVDGVVGMEGQGPDNGDPKELGLLMAGDNVFEVDDVVARIIGADPGQVLYLKRALEQDKFKTNNIDVSDYYTKFKPAEIPSMVKRFTKEYD
jgi:uncharacterized protein (DUF362 family)